MFIYNLPTILYILFLHMRWNYNNPTSLITEKYSCNTSFDVLTRSLLFDDMRILEPFISKLAQWSGGSINPLHGSIIKLLPEPSPVELTEILGGFCTSCLIASPAAHTPLLLLLLILAGAVIMVMKLSASGVFVLIMSLVSTSPANPIFLMSMSSCASAIFCLK